MKEHHCPDCGKTVLFTDSDCLCTDCRVASGMTPYDFLAVEISPWIKGVEQFDTLTGSDATCLYFFTPSHNGFSLSWVARGYGFSTTEFWLEEDGWHMEDEPYADDFLAEALKYFFANCKKG